MTQEEEKSNSVDSVEILLESEISNVVTEENQQEQIEVLKAAESERLQKEQEALIETQKEEIECLQKDLEVSKEKNTKLEQKVQKLNSQIKEERKQTRNREEKLKKQKEECESRQKKIEELEKLVISYNQRIWQFKNDMTGSLDRLTEVKPKELESVTEKVKPTENNAKIILLCMPKDSTRGLKRLSQLQNDLSEYPYIKIERYIVSMQANTAPHADVYIIDPTMKHKHSNWLKIRITDPKKMIYYNQTRILEEIKQSLEL